mmetsp:Transcript_23661/g.32293  ORF Transcript_23661/g.32293 Transcript_23661/m.32293 type:complete len:155 (+) Transcript_23661:242-706(+)
MSEGKQDSDYDDDSLHPFGESDIYLECEELEEAVEDQGSTQEKSEPSSAVSNTDFVVENVLETILGEDEEDDESLLSHSGNGGGRSQSNEDFEEMRHQPSPNIEDIASDAGSLFHFTLPLFFSNFSNTFHPPPKRKHFFSQNPQSFLPPLAFSF